MLGRRGNQKIARYIIGDHVKFYLTNLATEFKKSQDEVSHPKGNYLIMMITKMGSSKSSRRYQFGC